MPFRGYICTKTYREFHLFISENVREGGGDGPCTNTAERTVDRWSPLEGDLLVVGQDQSV